MVTSLVLNRVDVGLDPDEHALAQAARRGIYDRFEAQVAESSHLPDSSIATVVSNSVLEHVEHIDAVLAFVGRILRPGGRLIFTAPTEAFGAWLAVPNAHYACWRNRQLIHLNLWSSEQWRQRLGQAGLEVEIVWPYMRRAFVAGWDAMDLAEHIWIARRRLVGLAWHRIPPGTMEQLARRASRVDLSAFPPGGGRLIVARKR